MDFDPEEDPFEGPSSGSSYVPSEEEDVRRNDDLSDDFNPNNDTSSNLRIRSISPRALNETNAVASLNTDLMSTQDKYRKRIRNPKQWKANVAKEKCQKGESHFNNRGQYILARRVKNFKDCLSGCKFKCATKVTDSERLYLFKSYYKLDQNGKHLFLLSNTERHKTVRPKKTENTSYRQFSYKYSFNIKNNVIPVCKKFFLGTLSISQKPVYNAHKNKDSSNTPKPDGRGRNSSRRIKSSILEEVKAHINSFPRVESHYCRSVTNRQYLDPQLSLQKMYSLYKANNTNAVKFSMYRYIFNTSFNLGFHTRKSDRCDLCEEHITATKNNLVTEELSSKYQEHIIKKEAMRAERKKDRNNKNVPVLCFDLQNVIALPRAEISSFFYRRKLNVYNLTAHFSVTKTVYCAIWTECASGRGGNEIASAFKMILEKVAEEHHITRLITWSDSCVPQNRNSFISSAVLQFLAENPQITDLEMKYSVPGHSCIQEVDSAHSQIEQALSKAEIYSPLGLVRLLKTVNEKKPLRVILIKDNDFRDYGSVGKTLNFKNVPFASICALRFQGNLNEVKFLKTFHQKMYQICNLRPQDLPKQITSGSKTTNLNPGLYKNAGIISKEKKSDIKNMLKFMSDQDQKYYKALLKI